VPDFRQGDGAAVYNKDHRASAGAGSAAAEADDSNEGYQVGAHAYYQCGHLGVAL
jgi:hypothetical protein